MPSGNESVHIKAAVSQISSTVTLYVTLHCCGDATNAVSVSSKAFEYRLFDSSLLTRVIESPEAGPNNKNQHSTVMNSNFVQRFVYKMCSNDTVCPNTAYAVSKLESRLLVKMLLALLSHTTKNRMSMSKTVSVAITIFYCVNKYINNI